MASTLKGGFGFGAHHGKGIVSRRNRETGAWTAPGFLSLTGGSFGAQIGGQALDLVLVVMNNGYGISTPAGSQHGEKHIIDRGKSFGIPGEVVDGNDPIASWHAIQRAMNYCRSQRKPCMLEAMVSRLYGHSSSSGALRVKNEPDCIALFEEKLLAKGVIDSVQIDSIH